MGATAAPTSKGRSPGANSAGRPSSAAGNQPSHSKACLLLGRFPFTLKGPSPFKTHTADPTARPRKGGFPAARRRAGRDHGF